MHAGDSYLSAMGKATAHAVLSAAEAHTLSLALAADSKDFCQQSIISFIDALRAIESGFFSWATVKLYYSVFYALRSLLALDGDCFYYVGRSPKMICAQPGASTLSVKANTHKAVLDRFAVSHSGSFYLSQEIAGKFSLDWFTELRESANYTAARFCEPGIPPYFSFAASMSRRKMLTAYLTDDVYVFDEEHAIIAFPFKLLRDLRSTLSAKGVLPLTASEVEFLQAASKDRAGRLAGLDSVLC